VAVWRCTLSGHEDGYWVGIQFYWSQGMEFFDYHFTDDIQRKDRYTGEEKKRERI
jgi:hypothetical protein